MSAPAPSSTHPQPFPSPPALPVGSVMSPPSMMGQAPPAVPGQPQMYPPPYGYPYAVPPPNPYYPYPPPPGYGYLAAPYPYPPMYSGQAPFYPYGMSPPSAPVYPPYTPLHQTVASPASATQATTGGATPPSGTHTSSPTLSAAPYQTGIHVESYYDESLAKMVTAFVIMVPDLHLSPVLPQPSCLPYARVL